MLWELNPGIEWRLIDQVPDKVTEDQLVVGYACKQWQRTIPTKGSILWSTYNYEADAVCGIQPELHSLDIPLTYCAERATGWSCVRLQPF